MIRYRSHEINQGVIFQPHGHVIFILVVLKHLWFFPQVYFWSEPSKTKPEGALFTATADTSVTMKLRPFTKYTFQVVAFNSQGDGPPSQVFGPVTTPETSKLVSRV